MSSPLEVFFVIATLALWILFPIGIFLSVGRVDKDTDQLGRWENLRHSLLLEQRLAPREKAVLPRPMVATTFQRLVRQ